MCLPKTCEYLNPVRVTSLSFHMVTLYSLSTAKMGAAEFLEFHRGILDAVQTSGATMSHHHGIGKMTAPWLEGQIGKNELEVFRALKRHFDPKNVLNPGGTLALDLPDEARRLP